MDTPPPANRCPRCGTELPLDTLEGLCPACLIAGVVAPSAMSASDDPTMLSPVSVSSSGASGEAPRLATGQIFGSYRIGRLLGRGGMGEVYEAEQIEQGRRVALKVLGQRMRDFEGRARFLREGQLAASVSHPHTVYIFGSEEISGIPVIAMELLPGGTLKDLVERDGPLAPAAAVDAILQVIAGLDAAQAAGILHRDIKPGNCFTDHDGSVKVGDFGLSISTLARDVTEIGAPGAFQGTPQFAAPEQLRGEPLDIRADIYAVGATLYYLLTGRPPFDARDLMTLVARVTTEAPPSPGTLNSIVPKELAAIVVRCLAKNRTERPVTYAVLDEALRPFSSSAPMPAPLGKRFIAGLIDWALLGIVTLGFGMYAAAGWMYTRDKPAWLGLTPPLVSLIYWAIFEGHWGASVGKRMCGLRVTGPSGRPLGVARALWRWVVFGVAAWIAVMACGGNTFGPFRMFLMHVTTAIFGMYSTLLWGQIDPWLMLSASFPIQLGLLFFMARRRNGFAGLHDLASRARVVERRTRDARGVIENAVAPAPADGRHPRRIGPYDVVGALGTTEAGVLLVGFDPALRRHVWIHVLPPGTPPLASIIRDLNRPGRLRWLNGGRRADSAWDAYEAPGGAPFTTITKTPQPWSTVKYWLVDLASEFDAAQADGSNSAYTLDRVWITRSCRAIMLDFRAPGDIGPGDIESLGHLAIGSLNDQRASQTFLAELARVAIGEADTADGRAAVARFRAPLPLSAHILLASLATRGFDSWRQVVSQTTRLLAVPDRVTNGRRAAQLAACAALPTLSTVDFLLLLAPFLSGAVHSFAEMFTLIACAGVASAFISRGGLLLRSFGIAVVTRDGREASRLRAASRALIAWSPVVPMAWLMHVQSTISQVSLRRTQQSFNPAGTHVDAALGVAVVFVGCTVWAIVHPERGLQDRMAGTWLVPR